MEISLKFSDKIMTIFLKLNLSTVDAYNLFFSQKIHESGTIKKHNKVLLEQEKQLPGTGNF